MRITSTRLNWCSVVQCCSVLDTEFNNLNTKIQTILQAMKLQPYFTACKQSKIKYSQKYYYFIPVTEETGDVLVVRVLLVHALPLLIVSTVRELGDIVHLSIRTCQNHLRNRTSQNQSCSQFTVQLKMLINPSQYTFVKLTIQYFFIYCA